MNFMENLISLSFDLMNNQGVFLCILSIDILVHKTVFAGLCLLCLRYKFL